jgi:hypothetical protein
MEKCHFYQVEVRHLVDDTIRADGQQGIVTTKIPWCSHKHSPAPKSRVGMPGSARVLQCLGDQGKCQVPPDKFGDAA